MTIPAPTPSVSHSSAVSEQPRTQNPVTTVTLYLEMAWEFQLQSNNLQPKVSFYIPGCTLKWQQEDALARYGKAHLLQIQGQKCCLQTAGRKQFPPLHKAH